MSVLTCILNLTLIPRICRRDAASPTGDASPSRIWSTNQNINFFFFLKDRTGRCSTELRGTNPAKSRTFSVRPHNTASLWSFLYFIFENRSIMYNLYFPLLFDSPLKHKSSMNLWQTIYSTYRLKKSHETLCPLSHIEPAFSIKVGKLHWHMIDTLSKIK